MASRYGGITGTEQIANDYQNINIAFENVEADVDAKAAIVTDHINSTAAHAAEHITYSGSAAGDNVKDAIDTIDERIDTIIQGGGPDKDAELIDIRTPDPSYTPSRTINVAGDIVRDMQAQFGAQLADLTQVEVTYNGVTKKFKNESTTLYVDIDANVVSGNDGLSADKPIKLSDIATIFNGLKSAFPVLLGNWVVQLVEGTYQGDGTKHMLFLADIDSVEWIEFRGADVALGEVPTTILDGMLNGNTYTHGMFFQNMKVKVSNIKFQNFSESTVPNITTGNRVGLAVSGNKGAVWAYNVHTYLCSWSGLANQGVPRLYVEGGRFEYCRQGVTSMFNTEVTIGYRGSTSKPDAENTMFVNNIEAGVLLQSQTNGHCDYCIFQNNQGTALSLATSSEVNAVRNKFISNNIAMSAQSNSRILNSENTFAGNNQDFSIFYSGIIQQTANSDIGNRRRQIDQLLDTMGSYFVNNAPSGGGVFFSQVLQASSLYGRGKMLELIVFGRAQNTSSNTSTIVLSVSDGTNSVILATCPIGTTTIYKQFKLASYFSNFTQSSFVFNSEFVLDGENTKITNSNGIVIDSTKELTFTLELVVNGEASNSQLSTYRILPRVIF